MTIDWPIYLAATIPTSLFAVAGWLLSLARNNTTHVDSMWPLFIGTSAFVYTLFIYDIHSRNLLVLSLISVWAIRLCVYLTWRYANFPQARRHTVIANKLQPYFWLKSLYHIFLLYGFLAWIVSMPLFAAIENDTPLNWLDYLGACVMVTGLLIESVADSQMKRFLQTTNADQKVLTTGLWQYCRHPNYFGELCVWLGFYLIALATGAWWSIVSVCVMAYLLVFGSGIQSVESNIAQRRPNYQDYQRNTNMLLPYSRN